MLRGGEQEVIRTVTKQWRWLRSDDEDEPTHRRQKSAEADCSPQPKVWFFRVKINFPRDPACWEDIVDPEVSSLTSGGKFSDQLPSVFV